MEWKIRHVNDVRLLSEFKGQDPVQAAAACDPGHVLQEREQGEECQDHSPYHEDCKSPFKIHLDTNQNVFYINLLKTFRFP